MVGNFSWRRGEVSVNVLDEFEVLLRVCAAWAQSDWASAKHPLASACWASVGIKKRRMWHQQACVTSTAAVPVASGPHPTHSEASQKWPTHAKGVARPCETAKHSTESENRARWSKLLLVITASRRQAFCASLRSRNTHGHFTRVILCGKLKEKCRTRRLPPRSNTGL